MKLTIPVKELSQALATATQAVAKKTTIPVLSCVRLEAKGDKLLVDATDLEQWVSLSIPANVTREGAVCVDAKKLSGYVALLPHADLSLDVSENHRVTVKCGKSRTAIGGMSLNNFPERPNPHQPEAFTIAGAWLAKIQSRIGFAISTEESRYTLQGALMAFDKDLKAVSTDGHRLSYLELTPAQPFANKAKALMPKLAIDLAAKLFGSVETVKFSVDTNHVFIETDGQLLLCRKLSGNFPDYDRVLPRDFPHAVTVKREELGGCLSRIMKFVNEQSKAVKFAVNGELQLSTHGDDEAEESLPFAGAGEGHVGLNGQYVGDFIRAVGADDIELRFKDVENAVEFRESGTADHRYVVMPMRV